MMPALQPSWLAASVTLTSPPSAVRYTAASVLSSCSQAWRRGYPGRWPNRILPSDEAAVADVNLPDVRLARRAPEPRVVRTARAGLTEGQVRGQGPAVRPGRLPVGRRRRSLSLGRNEGRLGWRAPLTCGNVSYRPLASAVMSDRCSPLFDFGSRSLSHADHTPMISSWIDAVRAVARGAAGICDGMVARS